MDREQEGGPIGRGHIARRGVLAVSAVLLAAAGLLVAWQLLTPSGLDRQERRWQESEWSRSRRRARLEAERAEQATYDRHLARAELTADAAVEPPPRERPRGAHVEGRLRNRRVIRRPGKPVLERWRVGARPRQPRQRQPRGVPGPLRTSPLRRSHEGAAITMYMTPW